MTDPGTAREKTLQFCYRGLALKHRPMVYSVSRLAYSSAARCIKPHMVMSGGSGVFLVVCPADAKRLNAAGFEYFKQ